MAITARTIITNPIAASLAVCSTLAVGAASLFVLSGVCNTACPGSPQAALYTQSNPCDTVRRSNGFDRTTWSEYDWFRYAQCFSTRNDSRRTIEVTSQGLKYHPRSEALFNIKGLHLIKTRKYDKAIETLQLGMRRVGKPTSGTMANNLAWAGLWSPRDMTLKEARGLYRRALRVEPKVCETLHTGMMVEYGIVKQAKGFERVTALKNFAKLSDRYKPCMTRYRNGSWHSMTEVVGAVMVIEDVNAMMDAETTMDARVGYQFVSMDRTLSKRVTRSIKKRFRGASDDAICREALPFATYHHTCTKMLRKNAKTRALRTIRHAQPKRNWNP